MHVIGWHAVGPVAFSWRCHSSLPVAASKQRTWSRSSRLPDEQVTYALPATTTGDDTPRAGSLAFHFTPLSFDHTVGRAVSSETPEAFGPLNCGQSAAPTVSVSASVSAEPMR